MAPRKIGDLPQPPAWVSLEPLPIIVVSDSLTRIHRVGEDPKFFGKTGENRFDAPLEEPGKREFGMLYAATDQHGAFIETFGDGSNRVVTESSLSERAFARVTPSRPLRLVDLTGPGLARIGADSRLFAGEHTSAQQFSLALWKNPAVPDGLFYPARHDPSRRALAIYDRASDVVTCESLGSLMDRKHRSIIAAIIDSYGFGLIGGM